MEAIGSGVVAKERWSRLKTFEAVSRLDIWPTVCEAALRPSEAEKFRAKKEAIRLYFKGVSVKEIENKTNVCRTFLPRLAKKCLQLASDGKIFGYRALIPFARTSPNERRSAFQKKRSHQQGGYSGALNATFKRFPDLKDEMISLIRNEAKEQRVSEFRITTKTLHKIFIDHLRSLGVSQDEWPFNTRYLGKRTIQEYMRNCLHENFVRSVNNRGESPAKAHIRTGTTETPFLVFEEPFDALEVDAYNIDALLTVAFETPEGTETDLLLERLWIIAAVDRESTCVHAYKVVYRSEVTSDDVMSVIRDAVSKKWQPKELTFQANYPKSGGFPSGVIPETLGACWSIILFDGALAHLSAMIHQEVRSKLGVVISWGAPGHFERRPNVERTFGEISKDVFKRYPSTTGSNPQSGRANHADEKAIRYKLRAKLAEELIDLHFAKHNATPCEGISFLSPLEFVRYFLDERSQQFMLRKLPDAMLNGTSMFTRVLQVTVRGGIKSGRRPYIQFERAHYSSSVLHNLAILIGKKILIEIFDEEDIRQVKAFRLDGAELGFLKAQGRWERTRHSLRTRKAINSLMAKRELVVSEMDDPILKYLELLSTPKPDRKKGKPQLTRQQATDATRVAQEIGISTTISSPRNKGGKRPFGNDSRNLVSMLSMTSEVSDAKRKVRNKS